MASHELMNEWNSPIADGRQIEPPLTHPEVDAFEDAGVTPDMMIRFRTPSKVYFDIVKVALVECEYIRTPNDPEEAATMLHDNHLNAFR